MVSPATPISELRSFPGLPPRLAWSLLVGLTLLMPGAPNASAGHWRRIAPRQPFQPPYTVIDAVNVRAGTITISHRKSNNHAPETLRVSPLTDIQINSQTKKIGDLKKGMRVDVSHGTDAAEASRIVVGSG